MAPVCMIIVKHIQCSWHTCAQTCVLLHFFLLLFIAVRSSQLVSQAIVKMEMLMKMKPNANRQMKLQSKEMQKKNVHATLGVVMKTVEKLMCPWSRLKIQSNQENLQYDNRIDFYCLIAAAVSFF